MKAALAGILGILGAVLYVRGGGSAAGLAQCGLEYLAFMAMLASLYVVSGGIAVEGLWAGTPALNTAVLALGALLANVLGSVGACLLLLRFLLRCNRGRRRVAHTVVFFIFMVGNCGGLLTAFGNPPLTLGFLRGVPFFWTLRLLPEWLLVNGVLLALYFCVESRAFYLEGSDPQSPASGTAEGRNGAEAPVEGLRKAGLHGRLNLLLLGVVLVFLWAAGARFEPWLSGACGLSEPVAHALSLASQILVLGALAAASYRGTPAPLHRHNRFEFAPLLETGILFFGIFGALLPATALFEAKAASFALSSPWQYFWCSGALSSVLDNAPTYLVFAGIASAKAALPSSALGALALRSPRVLEALSCGSVMMGALTYIGNAPNWIVRSLAERHGVKMPGFLGYMAWSCVILLPLFLLVAYLFFN